MKRYIKSARDDNEEYFGEAEYNKYHKMVSRTLKGKKISKAVETAEEPGGIEYEADMLGIDMYDLIRCLEAMCINGEAMEVEDGVYLVK